MLSSELVRNVLDSLPDAMIIIDSTGVIRFANHQVSQLFGYAPGEVVGEKVERLLPERFRGRHEGHRQGYAQNVRERPMGPGLELFGLRKDGVEFPVEISLSPVAREPEALVAASIRDVTDRKRAEQALRDARRDAEHANLAKSRFLATASHDLRQPLQTLGLLIGALRRSVSDADCLDMVAQQEQALDAMSRLLNALLDISKLESGAIRVEPADFALATLFDEMRREFAGVAASKGLRLSIDATAAQVHSDAALVGQVLRNLLSNAIKYTRAGAVELRASEAGARVRLEVRDTGVGIATAQLPLIFDEFYQVGVSPNSTRDGYGLGLSIVRRISRLLGFRVEVSSAPSEGSTFAFELPAADGACAATLDGADADPAGADGATGAQRVLLVEDETGVRNAMRMLFKVEGYQVATAASVAEATGLLEADEKFDLVITDYHLGEGQTGTDVIAAARRVLGESMRAILVTGDTSSAVREIAADAQLRITSKPINARELLGLVRELLAG
ncbi:MAG TPA: ATP-binding protein [Steroidobacteraceae bacterium]|nr:ATP-binding protein [Steroidobacteraceae bacterium]